MSRTRAAWLLFWASALLASGAVWTGDVRLAEQAGILLACSGILALLYGDRND